MTDAQWTAFRVVLDPAVGAAAATVNQLQAIRAHVAGLHQSIRRSQQRVGFFDLGYKILAAGMINKSLMTKVRAKERQNTPYGEIMAYLEQEEANMGALATHADNKPHKTLLPTVGGTVAAIDDDDDGPPGDHAQYLEAVAALNSKFGKGKGKKNSSKGKGSNKPQQQQQQQAPKPAKPQQSDGGARPKYVKDYSKVGFGLPCNQCKKTGHWQNECPLAQEFADFKASRGGAGINATQALPSQHRPMPVDQRYQQFLALEAQQFGGQIGSVSFAGLAYDAMWSENANAEG
jgi:hypothetical protein